MFMFPLTVSEDSEVYTQYNSVSLNSDIVSFSLSASIMLNVLTQWWDSVLLYA